MDGDALQRLIAEAVGAAARRSRALRSPCSSPAASAAAAQGRAPLAAMLGLRW
jgi:hypothetical protein